MKNKASSESRLGSFLKRITGFTLGPIGLEWKHADPPSSVHTGRVSYEPYPYEPRGSSSFRVRINRLHDRAWTPAATQFANIRVSDQDCVWFEILDLKHDGIHMPEDFRNSDLAPIYAAATKYFHQKQRSPDDRRDHDLVLDVSVVNTGRNTSIVTGVAVVPYAVWAVPKHIHVAEVLRPSGVYEIPVDFEMGLCRFDFDDPIAMAPGAAWRFKLVLRHVVRQLAKLRANESLVAVRLLSPAGAIDSPLIYVGVL
jgi:hypothetical protein